MAFRDPVALQAVCKSPPPPAIQYYCMPNPPPPASTLASDVLADLLSKYGEVVGGADLQHVLGYRSARSFARAAALGHLPVSTFVLAGRRGRFARTRDLAQWLTQLGSQT